MQMQTVFVLFATTSYESQMYLVLKSQGFMEWRLGLKPARAEVLEDKQVLFKSS